MRKLLLTGVAVRIMPGSLIQLMIALMVVVLYIAAILVCRPYKAAQHNSIAVALYSMLAVTFVCGLLLKVKDGFESSGKYEEGYDAASITGVLIFSVVFVLVSGIGGMFYDLRRVINEPLFHFDNGGGIVSLPPLAPHLNFDLFLSHAQDLGQDQVAAIKYELEKLLPSVRIFLDVECLDDLHALDELVCGCKCVLIFLTTGCLRRYFVRLEIETAAKFGVTTILVQETDDRHGHTEISVHRDDCPDSAREAIFDTAHKQILWFRALHYKRVAIKQIVMRMIVDAVELPKIYLPHEIERQVLQLPELEKCGCKFHFWLPDCDTWCSQLATCLQDVLPGISIHRAPTGQFALHASKSSADNSPAQALLVPLNEKTLTDIGMLKDISAALATKQQMVLLHIQDRECGAVHFGRFFEICPNDIKDAGLFDELACPWFFNEPHLRVACQTVALKLVGKDDDEAKSISLLSKLFGKCVAFACSPAGQNHSPQVVHPSDIQEGGGNTDGECETDSTTELSAEPSPVETMVHEPREETVSESVIIDLESAGLEDVLVPPDEDEEL
jgi:hypothetical protein